MNERKMKTIFSQKLAGYLMLRGFVLVGMEQGRIYLVRTYFILMILMS